jgi:hypothetical protein
MQSTTSKVLTGCGIGCLLVIILGVGLGLMGYRWAREAVEAVEETERIQEELNARYGPIREFRPSASPGVPADRLEVFLAIREALSEHRDNLTLSVEGIAPSGGEGGVVTGFRAARAGMSMAPGILEFSRARNQALLDHDMGLGEYTWVYWYIYTAWLGHPADDSLLHEIMIERNQDDHGVDIRVDGGLEPERLTWRMRRDITAMLRNLIDDLDGQSEPSPIRDAIAGEVAALEADPSRVPWQDGLPEGFDVGLEPHRVSLEASYSRATNPFELIEFD